MASRQPRLVEVSVDYLAEDGLGAGTVDDRTLRLRNALPGERVEAVVRKRRHGTWFAETIAVREPAPERVVPPCAAFPRCGGCVLQHQDYRAQLRHKEAGLIALLHARGITPESLRPPVTGPRLHYRYKARLGVRSVDGEVLVGFREGFSNRITRTGECRILAPALAGALPELRAALAELSIADRIPQVELAAGDAGAAFVIRHLAPLAEADRRVLEAFGAHPGRIVCLQPGGYETVHTLADAGQSAAGQPWLMYTNPDFGLSFQFLPTDFTQVNPWINRELVRSAVLGLDVGPGTQAADLFSGIGNFALALARRGADVVGYESSTGAVERARCNAVRNGVAARTSFVVADLHGPAAALLPLAPLVVLDPPRSGAGPNLAAWAAVPAVERIAYVSCSPASFASDAAVLARAGFRLAEVGIFDMFPHTAHVETLGLFVRRG
ncbi:MAG: 23S rRNA (uracil(1939)-C(5))-methyltransferase RlmD [Pseudomonadales bacterium]|nr:23S rRNA (uracil(1939)-C(5))-methyltransferase RlmD [Pseudomonadales bacterium]